MTDLTPSIASAHVRAEAIQRSADRLSAWVVNIDHQLDLKPSIEPWPAQVGTADELADLRKREAAAVARIRNGFEELQAVSGELQKRKETAISLQTGVENRARELRVKMEEKQKGTSALERQIAELTQQISVLNSLIDLRRTRADRIAALTEQRGKLIAAADTRTYEWEYRSEAYRSLNAFARCLLHEFKRKYNGQNNGGISMSFREAVELVGHSNKPIPLAFAQLIDRGFVKVTEKGAFDRKMRTGGFLKASTWTLTEYAIDEPVRVADVPSKDFMRWRRPADLDAHDRALVAPKKKRRDAQSVRPVRPERTVSSETVRPERTSGTPRAYDEPQKLGGDGTPRAYTYSLPDKGASPRLTPSPQPTKGQAGAGGMHGLSPVGEQTAALLSSLLVRSSGAGQ